MSLLSIVVLLLSMPLQAWAQPRLPIIDMHHIPVAIHMGEGAPGAGYLFPKYRARLTSPYLLEEVLSRHPRLRVSVMHYGSPLIDEMIAMLGTYPQLYVDIGGIQWCYPRAYFYEQLRKLIDAGFGKRVMFGCDQMLWPGVIEPAIAIIEEAPFLGPEQKRDLLRQRRSLSPIQQGGDRKASHEVIRERPDDSMTPTKPAPARMDAALPLPAGRGRRRGPRPQGILAGPATPWIGIASLADPGFLIESRRPRYSSSRKTRFGDARPVTSPGTR